MMTMERVSNVVNGLKAPFVMVVVQVALGGVNVLYKLAANNRMSLKIIVAYRLIFATAFMAPVAFILERKRRPKLTWKVLMQAFFCGLFGGSMGQSLYLESLALTSATYAAAMLNLVPAITFILAVSFGLEKLSLRRAEGKAKVLGTIMGIGGAMLLTFYKGVQINLWTTHVNLLHHHPNGNAASVASLEHHHHRLMGSILAIGSCLCYSVWFIIQAKMSKEYPCQFSSTALMSFMGAIQALVYAFCREKDWNQWKLRWNVGLLTVVYSGIVGSGVCMALMTWCVRMRGPLFVSVFNPLLLVVVALAGSMVLDEKLYLGSILGAGLIICGLYAVLWGKGREGTRLSQLVPAVGSPEVDSIRIVVTSPSKDDDKASESKSQRSTRKDGESVERNNSANKDQAFEITMLPVPH